MVARRSNLRNLIRDAFEHRQAQASGRNWVATRLDENPNSPEADRSPFRVSVQHHGTHMFNVTRAGVVEPIDRGHGSQSDMCGVRAITSGYGCGGPGGLGYREVYDDEPMNRLSGDQWRGAIQDPDVGTLRGPPYPHEDHEFTYQQRGMPEFPNRVGLEQPVRDSTRDPRPAGRSRIDPEDTFNYEDMNRGGPDYSQPDPFGPAPAEGTAAELNEYLAGVGRRQAARRAARE